MEALNLEALDFSQVLEQFASQAASSKTAEFIRNAGLQSNLHTACQDLNLAREGAAFEQAGGYVSLGGLDDIVPYVKAAKKHIALLPQELVQIAVFLQACENLSKAFDPEKYPLLEEIAGTLSPLCRLKKNINDAIDLSGQIKPDATPELKSLTRKLQAAQADLSAAGKRFVKTHENSLMQSMTTTVNGRLCVLLKAADKYKYGGMLHGSSQSGAAFYAEPQVLVDANNEVSSLQLQIEEEKKKICMDLTLQVKDNASALLSNDESLLILDLALSKGKWMVIHDGCIPVLQTSSHALRIEHAVHPLLNRKTAVPNRYVMNAYQNLLLLTGANMGGKTVTLKTIALFIALAKAGYPVSAHSASLPWVETMYFDIGDSQSIENNLSTFSGHVKKLSEIIAHADENSFVLLDEPGNGTDPAQGAALAQAVLESLLERKALVVSSTHYSDVKAFGKTDERVLVGCVEFDPESLKPTYRFLPGQSGASYAYDIAFQFGLDPAVIERARQVQSENESEIQKQLTSLEKQQEKVQKQKDRFDELVKNAHSLQKEAEEQKEKWQKKRRDLDESYARELDDMLYEKKEEARAILKELRESSKKTAPQQIEQMARLNDLSDAPAVPAPAVEEPQSFKAGDYVRIAALNNHGEIQQVKKNKAVVLVNGRRVSVSVDQLSHMKRPGVQKSPVKSRPEKVFTAFPMELNLIGMRVAEGIDALDHYIDQAVYHRMKSVRIIHGMGTGALRTAVWDSLKKTPSVKKISAAGPNEGGLGATIVELK